MIDRANYKMEDSAVNFNSKDYIIAGQKRNRDGKLMVDLIAFRTIYFIQAKDVFSV